MDLRRLVPQHPAELLPKLGRILVPVLLDGVANGDIENFLLSAGDGHAAVPLTGHAPAIDHLAGRARHSHLGLNGVGIEY